MLRLALAALAVLAGLPSCVSEGNDDLKAQLADLTREISALRQEIEQLRAVSGRQAQPRREPGDMARRGDMRERAALATAAAGARGALIQAADPDGSSCQSSVVLTPQGVPEGDRDSLERVRRLVETRLQRMGAGEVSVTSDGASFTATWRQAASSRPEAVLTPLQREVALRGSPEQGAEPIKIGFVQGALNTDCARGAEGGAR